MSSKQKIAEIRSALIPYTLKVGRTIIIRNPVWSDQYYPKYCEAIAQKKLV